MQDRWDLDENVFKFFDIAVNQDEPVIMKISFVLEQPELEIPQG